MVPEEPLLEEMVPGVLVVIAAAQLRAAMVLGVGRAFEEVLRQVVTDLGVGQVIAAAQLLEEMVPGVVRVIAEERHQVAMVLGTRMVPMEEQLRAVMVPGTRRVLMGRRHQVVMTTTTAEPITGAIIHQRLSILIQRVVPIVEVGMPQGPPRQEP